MPEGILISPDDYATLGQMVNWWRTGRQQETPDTTPHRAVSRFPIHAVILDEELEEATILEPTSGMATICEWDDDAETYTQTAEQLKVWNHSGATHNVDTPGAAIAIHGHYWFFGDCGPMDERPAPPGGP